MSEILRLNANISSSASIDIHVDPNKSLKARLKFWNIDNQGGTSDIEISIDLVGVFTYSLSDDFTYDLPRAASIVRVGLTAGGHFDFAYIEG